MFSTRISIISIRISVDNEPPLFDAVIVYLVNSCITIGFPSIFPSELNLKPLGNSGVIDQDCIIPPEILGSISTESYFVNE